MRKKPEPLLSQPIEEFTEGEWLFVYKQKCRQIVERGLVDEFLFYELSRGLAREQRGVFDPCAYLKEIAEGWFPDVPFIELPQDVQKDLIGALRTPGSFFDIHVLKLKRPGIFQVNVSPCLTDEAADHLEEISRSAAESEARKWDCPDLELFLPRTNPGEEAVATERNRMLEAGMEIFEAGRVRLTLLLDLEVPDSTLVDEFTRLLKSVRSTPPAKEWEDRGKSKDPTGPLRDLAAYRLKAHCGSHGRVEEFRMKRKRPPFPIKAEAGWNKAVKRGEKMVADFKARFGANMDAGQGLDGKAVQETT